MDTIKNSVSHSAEALLLVGGGRGRQGQCGERLNLTFPRLFTCDPLNGLWLSDRWLVFKKKGMCVHLGTQVPVCVCVHLYLCVQMCVHLYVSMGGCGCV